MNLERCNDHSYFINKFECLLLQNQAVSDSFFFLAWIHDEGIFLFQLSNQMSKKKKSSFFPYAVFILSVAQIVLHFIPSFFFRINL